jgi:hypothetical protein
MKKRKPDARKPGESFKFNPFRVGEPGRKKGYFQFKTLDQAERCYQRDGACRVPSPRA